MGEAEFKANGMAVAVMDAVSDMGSASGSVMRLLTPGGRYQVRWDEGGSATAMGQLAFCVAPVVCRCGSNRFFWTDQG